MRRRPQLFFLVFVFSVAVAYITLRLRPYPEPSPVAPFLAGERPLVFAHRGARAYRVENTLPAFRLAAEQGVDVLELDVHLTRDGVVVVLHDESLLRTAGVDRRVADLSFADLSRIDNGKPGLRVPALAEVFRAFPRHRINIELKTDDERLPGALANLVREHGREASVLVGSTHGAPVREFRRLTEGRVATGATTFEVLLFSLWFQLDVPSRPDYVALQLPALPPERETQSKFGWLLKHLRSPDYIAYAHRHGLQVHYWTVNDTDLMLELLRAGADGIMTDVPGRGVAARNAYVRETADGER